MTPKWNKKDLSLVLNQEINFEANDIQFNSKEVKAGDLFIALKGNTDGHNYIKDALNNGANFAVATYKPDGLSGSDLEKIILVDDTYQTLLDLANFRRKQSTATFIAITGSCGKTSTKHHLANILSNFGNTFASKASFNNHLGVPLTIASIPPDCKYVVTEVGTNNAGEIKPLAQLIKPDIAIITGVLPSHIGNFGSLKEIAHEKGQIFQGLINQSSTAIINKGDNAEIFQILKQSAALSGIKNIITFGDELSSDCALLDYQLINNNSARLKFKIGGMMHECQTHLIGKHNAINLLSIVLVSCCLDLNLEKVMSLIEKCEPIDGRGKVLPINKFDTHFELIDDSYNANPGSVKAALENLASLDSNQKVAILSDMRELGGDEIKYHLDIEPYLKTAGVYKFVAVGELMKHLYDKVDGVEKYYFADFQALIDQISSIIKNKDLILFKGSNGTKLHKVVEYLKN
jgi:UDP-N-acetylmuramoyl-tripeptide--D-alanyl-D-alanine ligase